MAVRKSGVATMAPSRKRAGCIGEPPYRRLFPDEERV
jgi:hypothetical protein